MHKNPSKDEMLEAVLSSYQIALRNQGFDDAELAKLRWEQAHAFIAKPVKLKGWFDKRKKLPDGYRVIKGRVEETLIEHRHADWSTRHAAISSVEKLLGLTPKEQIEVTHTIDDIVGEVIEAIHKRNKGLPPLPCEQVDEE